MKTNTFFMYIFIILIIFILFFLFIKFIFKKKNNNININSTNDTRNNKNSNSDSDSKIKKVDENEYEYKELNLNVKIEKEKKIDFYNNNFKSGRDLNGECEKIICKGSEENMYAWNHECKVSENEGCPGKSGDGTYIDKCPESIINGKRVCQPICGELPKCN